MKVSLKFSLFLILFASCSKINEESVLFQKELITKSENSSYDKYNVSLEEATMLSKIHCRAYNKVSREIKCINPIVEKGDTLLYITNFKDSKGWMIISGDKRTQSVIALFEKNNFEIEKIPGTVNAWLTDIKESILNIKKSNNDNPSQNTLFWNEIERSILLSKQGKTVTKGGGEDMWLQLVYTIVETNDVQYDISHLTQTMWDQDSPWNSCVPYTNLNFTNRCATGCVAVSGAQMAYYLHYKIGKPIYTYANGSFYGIPSNYTYQFENYSSSIWDTMSLTVFDNEDTTSVAALMGYIGVKVNMNWGEESRANTSDLSNYFSEHGISTNYIDFNSTIAANSIINQMPIITRATDQLSSSGHSWIIDGLYVKRDKYTYYYQWMPRWTYPPVEPVEPDWNNLDQYVISDPVYSNTYTYFRMNWGWGLYGFSFFDGNYCYGDDWYLESYNLTAQRKMLYNFN